MSSLITGSDSPCDTCSAITIYIPRHPRQFNGSYGSRQLLREFRNLAELEEGAGRGCVFCKLLFACHVRSVGQSPAKVCNALKVYRVIRGYSVDTCFLKLECDHMYGRHSEQSLGVVLNENGKSKSPGSRIVSLII